MRLPPPHTRLPVTLPDGTVHESTVFLDQALDHPNIHVGAYSYYSDASMRTDTDLASRLAPYLFPGAPEHIHIGKFCQIAEGVQFITQSANHDMAGLTTYPFAIFDPARIGSYRKELPRGQDVVVGNDVWIGRGATLMPRAAIGDGAIIGAGAVVQGVVPPFAIYAGNPAKLVRMRFADAIIARLRQLAWWDWPKAKIEAAAHLLAAGDLDALETLAEARQ